MGAITSLYWAVQLLPLADVAVFGLLVPVFVAVAAPLLLGEQAGRAALLALPLCAVGVILVAQPSFLFRSLAQPLSALGMAVAVMQVSQRWARIKGAGRGCVGAGRQACGACVHTTAARGLGTPDRGCCTTALRSPSRLLPCRLHSWRLLS
jgi:hypothetical protein